MRIASLVGLLLRAAAFGISLPSIARADAASDAKDLFARGRDLRVHGDCANALPLFQKAYEVYPLGLGSLRNTAMCQEVLGLVASARGSWLELRRALATTSDRKYSGWSEYADQAVARLAPKVPHLTVDLAVVTPTGEPAAREGIDVTVDGRPLGADRIGVAVDRDLGACVVRASGAQASAPDEQTVELAAGENKQVSLRVTLLPAAPTEPAPAAVPPPVPIAMALARDVPRQGSSPLRTGAWVAFGVGTAGLAGAVVSLVVRQSTMNDLERRCPQFSACDPASTSAITDDVNRGHAASTLLDVLGAVGVAGAVTGVVLWVGSRRRPVSTGLFVSPAGVSAKGSF